MEVGVWSSRKGVGHQGRGVIKVLGMDHQADKGEGVAKGMCMAIRVCESET